MVPKYLEYFLGEAVCIILVDVLFGSGHSSSSGNGSGTVDGPSRGSSDFGNRGGSRGNLRAVNRGGFGGGNRNFANRTPNWGGNAKRGR